MAENSSDHDHYLHGDLDLKIIRARSLPNLDIVSRTLRRCFTSYEASSSAAASGELEIEHHRKIITSDPYVAVCIAQCIVAETRVIHNSQNPEWNEHFNITLAHPVINLEFQVKGRDVFRAKIIGTVLIPARTIISGEKISGWFSVIGSYGKPPKRDAALLLEMKFTPCDKNPLYQHGIAGDPEHLGVRHTYFPLKKGGSVTLYQDAHVRDGELPKIELEEEKVFEQHKCWEDICTAISEAHHLIYIVGWSIYHKVKLVRERRPPLPIIGDMTLGELLKYKSQEGVRVLLLVWDDKTSLINMTCKYVHYELDPMPDVQPMMMGAAALPPPNG